MTLSDSEKQLLVSIINNTNQVTDDQKAKFIQAINESKTQNDLLRKIADGFRVAEGLSKLMDLFID